MGCSTAKAKVPVSKNDKNQQVAGHAGAIKFVGDKLQKKCNAEEVNNYQAIYSTETFQASKEALSLQKMKPFVSKFYRSFTQDGAQWIEIENLLHKAPNASFMDIKLGTSTITQNTLKKGQAEIDRRNEKDAKTTSLS